MSYILDALRKSERDRQPTDLATLTPVQRSRSQKRSNRWLISLVLILAGNMVLLVYLTFGRGALDNLVPASTSKSTSASASASAGSVPTGSFERNATDTNVQQLDTSPIATDPLGVEEAVTIRPAVQTDEMRQLLASLTFTSHVFADDPALRSVMIDGRLFREGDSPQQGVALVSITSTGVVLRYRGREIAYNVMEQWEQL